MNKKHEEEVEMTDEQRAINKYRNSATAQKLEDSVPPGFSGRTKRLTIKQAHEEAEAINAWRHRRQAAKSTP